MIPFGKKFRYGAKTVGITALVVVAVLLLNVGVSALSARFLWQGDLTKTKLYTLSDEMESLISSTFSEVNEKRKNDGEDPVTADIVFCADPDVLRASERMRYVYNTALQLQKAFPETIRVRTEDVWKNPSSVDAYRTNSYASIYQTQVIIASGSEYRVQTMKSFFTFDPSDEQNPWAYSGEKTFARALIAVTKAEAPICGITVNHKEPFATEEGRKEYSELLRVIEGAGYEIRYLDLLNEEIPEKCRLLLTFDPQSDFAASFGSGVTSDTSEIAKLDRFLEKTYSFMVFTDADTPVLPNLEEFLEEWGISFGRYQNPENSAQILGNQQVVSESSVDSKGEVLIAEYAKASLGGTLTENLRNEGGSPKVVFGNAMPIYDSDIYEKAFIMANEQTGAPAYHYGYYSRNNHSRSSYTVFSSDPLSLAKVKTGGAFLTDQSGEEILADTKGNYALMSITREDRMRAEGEGYTSVNESSYVCAIGSTDFAGNTALGSNTYGNTDVLLETLRTVGKEVIPAGIDLKVLPVWEMTEFSTQTGEAYYTAGGNRAWTVILALLPAFVVGGTGTYRLIRRKYAN